MEENWITKKLDEYKTLYQGKFWNAGLSDDELTESNWGTTTNGCYPNSCSSNEFGGGAQCYAFSLFLAYILFGTKITSSDIYSAKDGDVVCGGYTIYKNNSSISNQTLEPGDIIRSDGHSAMVWRIGDTSSEYPGVRFAECWGNPGYDPEKPPKGCYLSWHYFNYDAGYTETVLKERAEFLIKAPGNTIVPTTPDTDEDSDTDEGDNTPKVDITYKRNINSDGGPDEIRINYEIGAELRPLPVPEPREGYEFVGWYTAASDGGKYENYSIARSDIPTIWAHWSYPVTMYYCNGSGGYETRNAVEKSSYEDNFLAAPPAGTMPSNYKFDGWYTAESGGTKISSSDKANGTNILYAHWIETVDVKFMQNTEANGDPVAHEGTYDVGSTYGTLPDPIARDERYSFLGWYTGQNSGDKYYHWSPVKSHRTQIWAHWQYGIELYMNEDDTEPVATITAQTGMKYGDLVPEDPYTKCGYDHIGWACDKERKTVCNLDDLVDNKTNKLYAIWKVKEVKVNYNYGYEVNGTVKTGEGTLNYGDTYAEAAGTNVPGMGNIEHPTGGYEFAGWHHDVVEGSDTVVMDADHTLMAMWEPKKYTVSFVAGDSEFASVIPEITVKYGQKYGCLPTPRSKDLYEFLYWEYCGEKCESSTEVFVTGHHTLTAHWNKVCLYNVYYEDSNGKSRKVSNTVNYGEPYVVPALTEKIGHDVKWIFSEEGSPYDSTDFFPGMLAIPEHPNTIKAVYTAKDIPITYDIRGGIIVIGEYKYETADKVMQEYGKGYSLYDAIKPGYTFAGWYYDEACTHPVGSTDVITNPEPHTIYAGWKKNITLTFDPGDSTFAETVEPKTIYLGELYGDLPVPKSVDNYLFYCWVETDENGDIINSEKIVDNEQDHTAVALWSTSRYLTLDPNGGTCSIGLYPVSFGNKYPRLPLPTREGYNFDGWYFLDENGAFGTKCERKDGFFVLPEHPGTVYAKWTPVDVTVTFNGMGGTPVFTSYVHAYGSNYALPWATRTGYIFTGWFFDENCTEQCTIDNIVTDVEDHTLYAGWSLDEVNSEN